MAASSPGTLMAESSSLLPLPLLPLPLPPIITISSPILTRVLLFFEAVAGYLSSMDKVHKLISISGLYSLGFFFLRSECSQAESEGSNTYLGWSLGIRSVCCSVRSEVLKTNFVWPLRLRSAGTGITQRLCLEVEDDSTYAWSDLLQIRSVLSSAYSCDWIVGVDATKVLVSVMFRWLHMFVDMAIRVLCRLGFCAEIGTDGASMRFRRVLGGSSYGYGSGGRSDECYLGGSGGDCEVCGFHQDWRRSFSPESFKLGMFSANDD